MDSFILAAHIQPDNAKKIIDVGCGCGIISLILAKKFPKLKITGVEIQKDLYRFAQKNIITNKLENTLDIIHENIKNIQVSDIKGKADIIVSNPPYKKKGSGRLNPDSQKAIARHEVTLDIDLLFHCSKRLLHSQGRVYIILPAQRLADLMRAMEPYQFAPCFIRFVHTKKNMAAKRVILSAAKNHGSACNIAPPLYVNAAKNRFSKEYLSVFKP